MKIVCLQEVLAGGFGRVMRTIPAQAAVSESLDVLLQNDNGKLKLSGTNLDMGVSVSVWVEAQVEGDDAVAIPAKTLNNLIRELPPGELTIESSSDPLGVTLTLPSGSTQLLGHSSERFPPVAEVEGGEFMQVQREAFRSILARTIKAASTEDSRPVLTGVKLDVGDGEMTMAAADGYRLAVEKGQLTGGGEPFGVVVPRKALEDLQALLGEGSDEIQFMVTPDRRRVLFRVDGVELVAQLIEGSFPDYGKLIPLSSKTEISIPLKQFRSAVAVATAVVAEGNGIIRCLFTKDEGSGNGGKLVVEGKSEEVGESRTEMPVKVSGEAINIAFSYRFLNDLLDAAEGDEIKLSTTSPSSPGLFTSAALDSYKHVIMPMFVQW